MLKDGNVPLVSSGNNCNGICKFIKNGDGISQKFNKASITVDMFRKVFFHLYSFFAVSHGRINVLLLKQDKSDCVKKFLCKSIEKSLEGLFSYSWMCSMKRLINQKILLPVDKNNNPDWEYM